MTYWERPAHPRLAPYVEAVAFSRDGERARNDEPIRVVPDGCLDMLFSVPMDSAVSAPAYVFGLKTSTLLVRPGTPVENLALSDRENLAIPREHLR
jgi:hypothetical protein